MNSMLRSAREQKGLKTREVAQLLKIDQALISKFESGTRKPTKEQIVKLATLLDINQEELLILWLKEKILDEIKEERFALEALKLVENELLHNSINIPQANVALDSILNEISILQERFKNINSFDLRRINKQIELEFVFNCNQINGSSMTFEETKLVINEGETIGGKPMKEHHEIINFYEALQKCKDIVQRKVSFDEKEFLQIHQILLRGLSNENAGKYVDKETSAAIETLFKWITINSSTISPLALAAEVHLKIMTILPFKNANNQMALLVMNLFLLQSDFYFVLLKGDSISKENYVTVLEQSLSEGKSQDFIIFIARQAKNTLSNILSLNK